jgi:hypothetical protein
MGKLALRLSNLDAKLAQQADLMHQAKDQYEKMEKRIADIAAATDDIEAEIRSTEKERDHLIAKSIPPAKDTDVQDLSLDTLTKFLNGAMGVVDSAVIIRTQEELASIARKVLQGQAASTATADFERTNPGTPGTPTLEPQQSLDTTHQGLTNTYELTTQALLQAKETHVLSLLALTQALGTAADTDAESTGAPPSAALHEANANVSAAQLAEQEADKANDAAKEALYQLTLRCDKNPQGGR